jgi:hypothetical protein
MSQAGLTLLRLDLFQLPRNRNFTRSSDYSAITKSYIMAYRFGKRPLPVPMSHVGFAVVVNTSIEKEH